MSRTHVLPLAGALLCCICAGCARTYRAETVLHADGSLDRAVYQPADDTPDAAKQAKVWKQITFAPKPADLDRDGWPDALTLLPVRAKDAEHPYFAAWNHFASVQALPETVFIKSPEGSELPDGKLERELTRTDLGFVEEYEWRETLTDVVNLEGMHKAREELADGAIQFGQDVFAEAVGKDYDASDLVKWLNSDGKDWFYEATDLVFVHLAAEKGPEVKKVLQNELAACCERRGLKLKKDGQFLKDEEMKQTFQDFVVRLVADKVKKDDKPVGREVALKWWEELNSKDGGRFKGAAEKVVASKYGGEKALGGRFAHATVRIIGLYLLSAPLDFQYTMSFPGPVVETNGELLGAGDKVRWRFAGADAYPLGYVMQARSLLAPEAARKWLGREALADREAVTSYADLVRRDEPLAAVMRQCREGHTLDPLVEYLAGQKKANPAEAARAEKALKLLKGS